MKLAILVALHLCFSITLGAPAFADCSLLKITQMPLVELGNHYAVMVKINDVMRPMIVDTGAEITTLNASAADKLDLTPDMASIGHLRPVVGIGQTAAKLYLNVIPAMFGLGDLVYRNRSTAVADMGFEQKLRESASIGLIGDDILSQYDVEFDFASKQLSFYRAQNCYDTFLPWTGPYAKVPFDHHDVKIVVDIVLNDERTRAIVDTGNNVSFVSRKSSALWNVPDDQFVNTKAVSTSPLNGGTSKPIRNYTFDTFKIGDETFYKKTIGIVDVDLSTGTANLGLDYFKTHKLWISYRNQMMFISRQPALSKLAYPVVEAKPMAGDGRTSIAVQTAPKELN
ncbi:aspartyl protease family protein [Methyloferula stellata]|uniref:aspartyl protease family protein n=1 Tax=Methyloferula stellata TaxID=876270 RepID=UPI00037033BD|nr:aspartyl protease family protein [Methyloferula stellata]